MGAGRRPLAHSPAPVGVRRGPLHHSCTHHKQAPQARALGPSSPFDPKGVLDSPAVTPQGRGQWTKTNCVHRGPLITCGTLNNW